MVKGLFQYKGGYKLHIFDFDDKINRSYNMRNLYNFNDHINYIRVISQTNIQMAELINLYLKKMPNNIINKAVMELKYEHEEKYRKDDPEKYSSIRNTLNLIAKQHVTNVDELFMGLAFEVNAYYKVKYLNLKKRVPYYEQCQFCQRYVSNHYSGKKNHQDKCPKKQGAIHNGIPIKIKKSIGTQTKDQNHQIDNIKDCQCQDSQSTQQRPSKKMKIIRKKNEKSKAKKRIIQIDQDDIYDGTMNFNYLTDQMYYYEDDDESLIRKGDQNTMGKCEQSSEDYVKEEHFGSSQLVKDQYVSGLLSMS